MLSVDTLGVRLRNFTTSDYRPLAFSIPCMHKSHRACVEDPASAYTEKNTEGFPAPVSAPIVNDMLREKHCSCDRAPLPLLQTVHVMCKDGLFVSSSADRDCLGAGPAFPCAEMLVPWI